jgi:hypothetical protein
MLASIEGEVAARREELAVLENKVQEKQELAASAAAVEEDVDSKREELALLESKVQESKGMLASIEGNVAARREELAVLENKVQGKQEVLISLAHDIELSESAKQKELAALELQIQENLEKASTTGCLQLVHVRPDLGEVQHPSKVYEGVRSKEDSDKDLVNVSQEHQPTSRILIGEGQSQGSTEGFSKGATLHPSDGNMEEHGSSNSKFDIRETAFAFQAYVDRVIQNDEHVRLL